jgi:hypothetical protein
MAANAPNEEEQKVVTIEIDEQTLEKIDAALENWESADIPARPQLDAELREFDVIVQQMREAVAASEQLSEEDLAIRINTRE